MINFIKIVVSIPALALLSTTQASSVRSRKMPRQYRSRTTVRRILDAAAGVLEERGYEGASTNRIAAAAGISPGSLYQYFPNKDAILKTIVAEYTQQLLEGISARLREVAKYKPALSVSAAIRAQIDAMLERPEILRVACQQSAQSSCVDVLAPLEAAMADTIRAYAVALPGPPPDVDVDAATWLIVQLLGATVRYVVDQPSISKDSFVNELARIVVEHPIVKALARQRQ